MKILSKALLGSNPHLFLLHLYINNINSKRDNIETKALEGLCLGFNWPWILLPLSITIPKHCPFVCHVGDNMNTSIYFDNINDDNTQMYPSYASGLFWVLIHLV